MSARIQQSSANKTIQPKLGFTRVEAAQALGISPNSLDRLATRGLIHPSRALRRPLYSLSELQRFLAETT
jgi:ribosomal protein S20